jgi:uncharacterized protein YbaR (Trm112 family)
MITCPECKKEVSDRANVCPNCGNPLQLDTANETPTTIQRTKKGWKGVKAVALIMCFGGLILAFQPGLSGLGIMLLFFGFLLGIIANIGSWWSTG